MLIPAISFPSNCKEAIEYYKSVFGAEVNKLGFDENKNPDFVMHSELTIYGGKVNMSDNDGTSIEPVGLTFNIFLKNEKEVSALFNKLAERGEVRVPLQTDCWTDLWGYIADPFGLEWCIAVEHD
ncbi:MAG: glyoxalase/bleomycin resistance/extradiol dioxygenase family protein [Defluviitaleaceae bacterium]|nr:glyoxalase/bleomycin resistance/extradiol dioxygenase family protein [Defluviitaleaceae bacterium]